MRLNRSFLLSIETFLPSGRYLFQKSTVHANANNCLSPNNQQFPYFFLFIVPRKFKWDVKTFFQRFHLNLECISNLPVRSHWPQITLMPRDCKHFIVLYLFVMCLTPLEMHEICFSDSQWGTFNVRIVSISFA